MAAICVVHVRPSVRLDRRVDRKDFLPLLVRYSVIADAHTTQTVCRSSRSSILATVMMIRSSDDEFGY